MFAAGAPQHSGWQVPGPKQASSESRRLSLLSKPLMLHAGGRAAGAGPGPASESASQSLKFQRQRPRLTPPGAGESAALGGGGAAGAVAVTVARATWRRHPAGRGDLATPAAPEPETAAPA